MEQTRFQVDLHQNLFFGENYTFFLRTIACQNNCNEDSDPIIHETGNKK